MPIIKNIKDAIDTVIGTGFEKGTIIFRGQVNSKWSIQPTLFRSYNDARLVNMYEGATLFSPFDSELGINTEHLNSLDPISHLMDAQHFGSPTRLLDWTSDILISLFSHVMTKNWNIKIKMELFIW